MRDDEGWVLLADQAPGGLGGALAWAHGQGLSSLHLVTDEGSDAGTVARRAAFFSSPPKVWRVDGRALRPAGAEPRPTPPPVPPAVAELRAVIVAAGAEPVEEHGALTGEVAGLEVCRAVVDGDGTVRLDVGLGAHDREAFRLIHGDGPIGPALAGVVEQVASHRRVGAPPHALNRLARDRALRARLVDDPELIGLTSLAPAPPPVARGNPSDPVPCVALGRGSDATPVVVVCSAGVDLDLVPFAADAREGLAGPEARLLLAVPEPDDHPVTQRLAARLAVPAEVVPVPPERPAT